MFLLIVRRGLMIESILQVSDDGRYVLLSIREGCDPVNRLWYCDLQTTPQGITGVLLLFIYVNLWICAPTLIIYHYLVNYL